MKVTAIPLLCLLLSLTLPCISGKRESSERRTHDRTKRSVVQVIAAGVSIISRAASFGIKLYQFIQNGGDGDLQTDAELKTKVESTLKAVEQNNKQQDEIKNLIKLSLYQSHIAADRKEILSCFGTFNFVLREPESVAAREMMEMCNDIEKYVSDIGRMLTGKPITIGQKPIFDLIIDSKGRCDHRDINATFAYLYDLHLKGCLAITLAESMKYGNESRHFQNNCERTFQEAQLYHKDLYKKCSQELCYRTILTIRETLTSPQTCTEAASTLSQVLPWFDFTILDLKARGKSYHHGPGRLRSTTVSLHYSSFFKLFWTVNDEYQTKAYKTRNGMAVFQIPSTNVLDHYSRGSLEIQESFTASTNASSVYKGLTLQTTDNETYFLVSGETENRPSTCESGTSGTSASGSDTLRVNMLLVTALMSVIYCAAHCPNLLRF